MMARSVVAKTQRSLLNFSSALEITAHKVQNCERSGPDQVHENAVVIYPRSQPVHCQVALSLL